MLMEEIRAAAALEPQGIVQGLGLSSLLQLLHWERKTATLTVQLKEIVGFLYVKGGNLIHAAAGREEGLATAYRILGWEGAHVEFVGTCRVQASIELAMTELLLNAALLRDVKPHFPTSVPEPWYD